MNDPYVGLELEPEDLMGFLFTIRSYNGRSVGRQPQIMIRWISTLIE